jgi:hypothetical protein
MPAPSDEPLARCHLLLYERDKAWFYRRYGWGWSVVVRRLIREHIRESEAEGKAIPLEGLLKGGGDG